LRENIDVTDFRKKISYDRLKNYDVVYVCGGNTFYILHWARKSGFVSSVKNFLKDGKLYIGSSAGSNIACQTIEMVIWKHSDRNMIGLKDLTAMNLVPFMIVAHYTKRYQKAIKKAVSKNGYSVKPIRDGQAISVRGNKIKFIGKEIKVQ
jgi:dipeptidase E